MTHRARLVTVTVPLLAGGLLLSACSGGSSTGTTASATTGEATVATSPSPAETGSTAPATSAPTATTAASAPASPAVATSAPAAATTRPATTAPSAGPSVPSAKGILVLEPDGLGIASESGSIRHLPFGQSDATMLKAALTNTLGAPTAGNLPECGQGARKYLQVNGFQVLLDGTKFVGWTDSGAKGRTLTTVAGLGIGSTLKAVKAEMNEVTVQTDSLGPEFFTSDGTFGGMLTGTKDASTVTLIYAGETCFFR